MGTNLTLSDLNHPYALKVPVRSLRPAGSRRPASGDAACQSPRWALGAVATRSR